MMDSLLKVEISREDLERVIALAEPGERIPLSAFLASGKGEVSAEDIRWALDQIEKNPQRAAYMIPCVKRMNGGTMAEEGVLIGEMVEGRPIQQWGKGPTYRGKVIYEDLPHDRVFIQTEDGHLHTLAIEGLKRLGEPTGHKDEG